MQMHYDSRITITLPTISVENIGSLSTESSIQNKHEDQGSLRPKNHAIFNT